MIFTKIEELKAELAFYCAVHDDYVVSGMPVVGIGTDAVYADFCRRHPEIDVGVQRFTKVLCSELGLKSVQSSLDGQRGYFYEKS